MAQYEVLRPIEFNSKLYVPASTDFPATVKSAGNGANIPVDRTGIIDLPASISDQLRLGQIGAIKPKAKK